MSRPLNALEGAPSFGFEPGVEGERVYFQLTLEDATGGDGTLGAGNSALGFDLYSSVPPYEFMGKLVQSTELGGLALDRGLPKPTLAGSGSLEGHRQAMARWRKQNLVPFTGGQYLTPSGEPGGAFTFSLNDQGGISKSGTVNLDTPDTGRAAPAFSGTKAAQDAQIAASWRQQEALLKAQAAEAERNRDWETAERLAGEAFQAGQNADALENQMKQTLIGEAGALQRTQLQLKGQARDLIAELYGKDYLRAGLRQAGQVARGVTPHMAFMGQLGQTRDAPIQQVSSGMTTEELEAAITTLRGNQVLPSPNPLAIPGRASGGPIAEGQAVRVGELGEEIVINEGGGRMRVVPIVANAADGGEFDFDSQAIGQMMDRIYSHLGVPSGYTLRDTGSGILPEIGGVPAWAAGQPGALALSERMGINPRLIRSSSERQLGEDPNQGMFWIDQEGVAHQMTPQQAQSWGFNIEDFMFAAPSEIGSRFDIGAALAAAPPTQEREKGRFPLQPGPLRLPEELGSFAVMSPRTIANLYRSFTPTQRDILLSALEIANFGTEEDLLNEIQAFTPSGTAPQAVSFG